MLCRALLTAVAVSYLLCVLLLSGVQKDDLDVNTVKKLLRHNVNISAFDDLKVRQECIAKAIYEYQNRNTESHNGDDEDNKTLRRKETYEVRTTDYTNGNNYHEKLDLESVINYATNRRQFLPELKDIEDTTAKQTNTQHKEVQYDHKDENNNSSTEIGYTHSISNYENLRSLWKKYGRNQPASVKPTTTPPHTDHNDVDINFEHYDSKLQCNSTSPSLEVEYIRRMLAQYMSKTKDVTATTVMSTPKETYSLDKPRPIPSWISDDPESFLFGSNKPTTNTTNPELDKLREKYLNDVLDIESKQIEKLRHTSEKSKNKTLRVTINDILMFKENFKQFPFKYISDNTHEDNHVHSDNDVYANEGAKLRSNYPKNHKTAKVPKKIIKTTTILPVNLIKEIAESVKAILLQDIRKEISTTTRDSSRSTTRQPETTTRSTTRSVNTTPTSTTSTIASTTERSTSLKTVDKSVIDKIMELFQQLKNTQENTTTNANAKHKITVMKNNIAAFDVNYKVRNDDGNQQMPKEPYPSNQMNSFSLQPINPAVLQTIPINNMNIYHPPAITLQTNLNEIPPLGIPVSKQMSLINQNIIVTTRNPFAVPIKPKSIITNDFLYKHENETIESTQNEKTKLTPTLGTFKDITVDKNLNDKLPTFMDLSKRERINPIQDAYDASADRNRNDRLYTNPKRVQDNDAPMHIAINNIPSVRERNDMLLKMYSGSPKDRGFENPVRDNHWNAHRDEARFYTKNRGRARNRDYGSSRWDHNYKARYDTDDNDRARPQREHIKRFHEQLEKYELPRNSREPVLYRDSSRKERPVPREQLPLANVKKSNYDDTHFRNFLSTQQKVNEMLENILATKRKLEERKLDRVLSTQSL